MSRTAHQKVCILNSKSISTRGIQCNIYLHMQQQSVQQHATGGHSAANLLLLLQLLQLSTACIEQCALLYCHVNSVGCTYLAPPKAAAAPTVAGPPHARHCDAATQRNARAITSVVCCSSSKYRALGSCRVSRDKHPKLYQRCWHHAASS